MKASMSRSPLTHYSIRRSPSWPIPRRGTSPGPTRFAHHQDTERRQWPPSNRKFCVYESPSPSSSQDGKSSSSSAKSARSETTEERRVRTVSPYGSFFAEEMESDTPAENRSNTGDRQEHRNVSIPAQRPKHRVLFTTVPALQGPGPDHHDSSSNNMTEMPVSALYLAENSRRSQPPLSWRQGYPDHPDHPQLGCISQYDPPQVATAVPRDKQQTDARNGSRRQR